MNWLHTSIQSKVIKALGLVVSLALIASACATPGTTPTPGPTSPTPTGTPSPTSTSPTPKVTPSVTPSPTPTTAPVPAAKGTLEVRVTDPPPPKGAIDHVWVTVQNLEVHQSGDKWTTLSVNATSFDLKALVGIEQFLGSQIVEAGNYTQVRLDVKTVTVESQGKKFEANVPSEQIKLVGGFQVIPGKTTTITLDFDGEKSVVETGQGKYQFKPVIKLLVRHPDDKEKPKPAEEKEPKLDITTATLPDGQVGVAYSANLTATGGKKPYTWSIVSGSLPAGLSLGGAPGNITGTPSLAVSANFTVQVKDSAEKPNTDNQSLSIRIN